MIITGNRQKKTKTMITRRLKIKNLENTRMFVSQVLDTMIIVVEEKINREWQPLVRDEHKIDLEKFDLIDLIEQALQEYAKKKKIEEEVGKVLNQYENDDEIDFL